jgi:hypothetical protein
VEVFVVGPQPAADLFGVGIERGVGERDFQHRTHLPLDALVGIVPLVLEAIGDPEIVVLLGADSQLLFEPLLGCVLLRLSRGGMRGDCAVPVAVPQPLGRGALGEQNSTLGVEDETGERPVADPVAGVGLEPVDRSLFDVVGIDGDDVLCGVFVVDVGVSGVAGRIRRVGVL